MTAKLSSFGWAEQQEMAEAVQDGGAVPGTAEQCAAPLAERTVHVVLV